MDESESAVRWYVRRAVHLVWAGAPPPRLPYLHSSCSTHDLPTLIHVPHMRGSRGSGAGSEGVPGESPAHASADLADLVLQAGVRTAESVVGDPRAWRHSGHVGALVGTPVEPHT